MVFYLAMCVWGVSVCVTCNGVCLRLGDMLYVLCVYYKRNKMEKGQGKGRGEGEKVYKVEIEREKRNTKRGKQRKLS